MFFLHSFLIPFLLFHCPSSWSGKDGDSLSTGEPKFWTKNLTLRRTQPKQPSLQKQNLLTWEIIQFTWEIICSFQFYDLILVSDDLWLACVFHSSKCLAKLFCKSNICRVVKLLIIGIRPPLSTHSNSSSSYPPASCWLLLTSLSFKYFPFQLFEAAMG